MAVLVDSDFFEPIPASGPVIEIEIDQGDALLVDELAEAIAGLLDEKVRGAWVVSCDGKTQRFSGEFDDT